ADARRPHRLAAAGLPARHPLALARYRRRGQDRGARRIDLLVCAADAADVPRAAGAAAPRRRLLERAARLLRAHFRALPADGMGARQIRFHTLSKCRKAFHAANTVSRPRRRRYAVARAGGPGRAGGYTGRQRQPAPRHWHGYGFLPGYRPPEVIARERAEHYWASGPHYYGPAWPRFYRGRWNGGGFGPRYTQTPIGYMWNCGQ